MQKNHRNTYDWAIRMTGVRMIEVETVAELRAALSERTAMIAITGDSDERNNIPVAEMIRIGHEHGVICIVDAAAERPDIPNRFLKMGADAVAYSGGKCLRGPQASGLVLGRRDLLWAAFMNGAPHHALGRPMKAGKEEIMGLLAAVEAWVLGRDHAAEWRMWEGWLETMRQAVADLPSIQTFVDQPGPSNHAPTLRIQWDPLVLHCTPKQIEQELREGEPRIVMHLMKDGLRVMPYMMEDGDAEIAAPRLRALLKDRPAQPQPASGKPMDVSGAWQIHTQYVLGQSVHAMTVTQEGEAIKGRYRGQYSAVEVLGTVVGDQVEFAVTLGYQTNRARYTFTGAIEGAQGVGQQMSGTVSLGEFGSARWSAKRVGQ